MKIDDRIEQQVRDTLHWVVKRRADDFDRALGQFESDADRKAALELLTAIIAVVLVDEYGQLPSAEQIDSLAAQMAGMERWSTVTADEIATFLKAVATGSPRFEEISAEGLVILPFLIAGNLLSSHPKEEGTWWFDYLDKVEAVIEARG